MKNIFILVFLTFVLSACASGPAGDLRYSNQTRTDLTKNNYRVIDSNVRGESKGFNFLGFIPIVSPSYADAMGAIHDKIDMEGKAAALANVAKDYSSVYLILFSIPKLTVTADVVEFLEENEEEYSK